MMEPETQYEVWMGEQVMPAWIGPALHEMDAIKKSLHDAGYSGAKVTPAGIDVGDEDFQDMLGDLDDYHVYALEPGEDPEAWEERLEARNAEWEEERKKRKDRETY